MSSRSERFLSIPGPAMGGRRWLMQDDTGGWVSHDGHPKAGASAGFAFSAFDCYSVPLWVNSEDPQITRQIVTMELERLAGLTIDPSSSHLTIQRVATEGSQHLVLALVIPDQLPPDAPLRGDWSEFTFSPLLAHLPDRSLCLWAEEGRYVAAFSKSGQLSHVHAFGRGDLSEATFIELRCLYQDLRARGICDDVERVMIFSDESLVDSLQEQFAAILSLPVEVRPDSARLFRAAPSICVVPQQITDARASLTRRRRGAAKISLALAACITLAAIAFWSLTSLKSKNRELLAQIEALSPEADTIRDTRDRWDRLKLAIDPDRYPVEIFHQVALLLPEKGIRLNQFEIEGDQIIIRGEASSVPTAITFKADLEKSEGLNQFSWEVPPPQIKGDTAVFSAYGTNRAAAPTS